MSESLRLALVMCLVLSTPSRITGQVVPDGDGDPAAESLALNLFIDCDYCARTSARREITFVNHVRDPAEAQIHLLVTRQPAGFGTKYTMNFIGRDEFVGVNDTLHYVSVVGATDDERRSGLIRVMKAGLVRYLARTPPVPDVTVSVHRARERTRQVTAADDPWKLWTFQVGLDGSYDGEASKNDFWVSSYLAANRVSDGWKFRLLASGNYSESNFDLDGTTITSSRENAEGDVQIIRSLGNHFAIGLFGRVSTSSFRNTDLSSTVAPAFEYTVFPYSESSRRELRFSYYINFRHFDYREITVFQKTSENLLHHELQIHLEMRQPWGSASMTLAGSEYITDFRKTVTDLYRVTLSGFTELRVAKGLSLFATADASRIRDQIFLRRQAASPEDVLLGRVQLPTTYQYDITLGVSFTFGSIYSNIVNPRFGT